MLDEILVPDTSTIVVVALTSLLIAGIAFYKRVLDQGGSALAFLICFVSGTLGHWSWLLLLLIFVGSSFLATRFAIVYKMALGLSLIHI